MIGRTLKHRYEVHELLGEGSTAAVYKGHDRRLGRDIALKVLLPHVKETTRKRFFQEAYAVAMLNHPNIMAIYDSDDDGDAHFLVVEYVQGDPLTKYIPSSPDVSMRLGRQIALALGYAHERQIIHRDVKPANIMVTPAGQIKIMDLGLALPKEAKRVTADGMIIGTPAYLSPEQAQGSALDSRTDIYSLGVVLYEMATGQLPFSTDDIPALLLQHVKQPPPPPRLHNSAISPQLEAVILKALEKNPTRRFQSMEAFASALDGALAAGAETGFQSAPATSYTPTQQTRAAVPDRIGAKTLRVVLADDHTILRRALASMLATRDDILVIGEASNGEEAIAKVVELKPDVLILDLNMPGKGGLDALPDIRSQAPSVKVLILTGREEDWYIMQALRSGAHGYILKSADEADLIDSIARVTQGSIVLGRGVAEKVVTGMISTRQDRTLSDNERTMALYVAMGMDNDQIAAKMGITMVTLTETLASMMVKLGAKNRDQAALQALRRGDITLSELQGY
jgi:serine/threonine protein kinase/DNA-binding CsgD family transcriptional regulator